MTGQQSKILNRKLNSILQSQADSGAKTSVSGIEADVMLRTVELRMQKQMDVMDKNNELRVKAQTDSFNSALNNLHLTAK